MSLPPEPVGPTMNPLVPAAVLYAGLAGVLLALIVSTAQNKWQLRVFVLLALRLAIGWHFLFEGLHKVQSTYVGPTDTNKVFTSEPYFAVAEGPFGEKLRKDYLGDPESVYPAMLDRSEPMTADEFRKLPVEKQADLCPAGVTNELKAGVAAVLERDKDMLKKSLAIPEDQAAMAANDIRNAEIDSRMKLLGNEGQALRAKYARWVYGVDRREAKVNMIAGDLQQSAPERLHSIDLLQRELDEFTSRQQKRLGTGNGIEMARTKKAQTELQTAKADLAKDAKAFVVELEKEATFDPPKESPPRMIRVLNSVGIDSFQRPIEAIDWLTRWTITAIGAGLLLGLFTRVWCLAGIGFLVMTYLSHPTVPWLPLPPGTEGNPLFINKNLIEALGLLVILAHPTGRWLGLDALIHRLVFPRSPGPA